MHMNATTAPEWASPKETCARFGLGLTKLYELIRTGRIRARKLGSRTLIDQGSVLRVIEEAPAP